MEKRDAPVEVRFRRLSPEAVLPGYQTDGAAGFDLHAAEDMEIPRGQWRGVDTGWAVAVPRGYELQIRPRSGLALHHGVTLLNTPGTVDSDYRGPVKILLVNLGNAPFTVSRGDRIAQGVLAPVTTARMSEVGELGGTARGDGGFGSTGISS